MKPDGQTELLVTGLECVRSDWTQLAQRVQRELLSRIFCDEPFEAWLQQQVRDLRAGRLDAELVVPSAAAQVAGSPIRTATRRM